MTKPQQLPDQFELLERVSRQNRLFVVFGILGMLVGLLGAFTVFAVGTAPTPVVIWPDNPHAPAALVKTGEVTVREVDAKRFFLIAADHLLGWNSADVKTTFDQAKLLMNREWRSQFNASLEKMVEVPKEISPKGTMTSLSWMISSKVRNEVEPIKLEDITCSRVGGDSGEAQWNCKALVKVAAQPLFGAPLDDPSLRRRVLVQAGFKEYSVTNSAIYGLLISYWEVIDKDVE